MTSTAAVVSPEAGSTNPAVPALPPMQGPQSQTHHIQQTLFGPICTHPRCDKKVSDRNSLFYLNYNTIGRHWKKKKCYTGPKPPNARALAKQLQEQLVRLHGRIARDQMSVDTLIDKYISPDLSKLCFSGHCKRCGYVDQPGRIQRYHISSTKTPCTMLDLNRRGEIYITQHGFKVPKAMLEKIASGSSPILPSSNPTHASLSNHDSNQTTAGPDTNDAAAPAILEETFAASAMEIDQVCADTFEPTAAFEYREALDQLSCFGEGAPQAKKHINTFVHLMQGEQPLGATLFDMASNLVCHDPNLQLTFLLKASDLWYSSQAANLDVRKLGANLRGLLYLIGNEAADSKPDMLGGKTFVPSEKVESIKEETRLLITFAFSTKWPKMQRHLQQVWEIYHAVPESEHETEDERDHRVAATIVETSIVPGLLLTMLLEKPSEPNGPTLIMNYLAARSVTATNANSISMKYANDISKHANAALRSFRHAVCSVLVRKAREMNANSSTDDTFQDYAEKLIKKIQWCPASDSICRQIRLGREVDKGMPKKVTKAFFPDGEVYVQDISIVKPIWKRSLAEAISILDAHISTFFPCTDDIKKIFDVRNRFVHAGKDSKVIIAGPANEELMMSDIHPNLNGNPDDIKMAIYGCWKFDVGLHGYFGYFGSGAARGEEMKRLPDFSKSQLIFNSIRYQMRSQKGESGGVVENEMVTHYLSPATSRRKLLLELVIYPAVKSSLSYSLPDSNNSAKAADEMFAEVMKLDKPAGTGNNRDLVAQMCNYLAQNPTGKVSTSPQIAAQFHHTKETHDTWYSSERFVRSEDGTIIRQHLMVAHDIWSDFGEQEALLANNISAPNVNRILERHHFDIAAQRAYGSPNARVFDHQYEAIRHAYLNSFRRHAFLLLGAGHGKSGVYINLVLAMKLFGIRGIRVMVVSPHNALLTQHHCYYGRFSNRFRRLLLNNLLISCYATHHPNSGLFWPPVSSPCFLTTQGEQKIHRTLCMKHLFLTKVIYPGKKFEGFV